MLTQYITHSRKKSEADVRKCPILVYVIDYITKGYIVNNKFSLDNQELPYP